MTTFELDPFYASSKMKHSPASCFTYNFTGFVIS